jgi:hypothetical protein
VHGDDERVGVSETLRLHERLVESVEAEEPRLRVHVDEMGTSARVEERVGRRDERDRGNERDAAGLRAERERREMERGRAVRDGRGAGRPDGRGERPLERVDAGSRRQVVTPRGGLESVYVLFGDPLVRVADRLHAPPFESPRSSSTVSHRSFVSLA